MTKFNTTMNDDRLGSAQGAGGVRPDDRRGGGRSRGPAVRLLMAMLVVFGVLTVSVQAAQAASPAWKLTTVNGPTNLPTAQSEIQQVAVDATGGTFTLTQATASGTGTLAVASGIANLTSGSNSVSILLTLSGTFAVGQTVTGPGVPAGTTITAVGAGTLTLSANATATGSFVTLSAGSNQVTGVSTTSGTFRVGDAIAATGIPAGATVTAVGAGTLTLSVGATAGGTTTLTASESTAPIPYDAPAQGTGSLKEALEALPVFGSGSITAVGGPGDAGADHPYSVTFGGPFANTDVLQLTANSGALSGAGHRVQVTTALPGGPGTGTIAIYAINVGGAPTSGTVTVTDALPEGLTTSATPAGPGWSCTPLGAGNRNVTCTTGISTLGGHSTDPIKIPVSVGPTASGTVSHQVSASGGGAAAATVTGDVTISNARVPYGIQAFQAGVYDDDGNPETQAGSHPHHAMTAFFLNTNVAQDGSIVPAGNARDIDVDLPPGFIGNPQAGPRCAAINLRPEQLGECQPNTVVGAASALIQQFGAKASQDSGNSAAVFNNQPPDGFPAQFSFSAAAISLNVEGALRSDDDYGVTISSQGTPQFYQVFGALFTVWGTPADPVHDRERCIVGSCSATPVAGPRSAFLTNPTDCPAEAQSSPVARLRTNSYEHRDVFDTMDAPQPPVVGCDQVPFTPTVSVTPSSSGADSASGLDVDIKVPQDGLLDPDAIAQSQLKKAVVQLPEGVSVNPSGATGLAGCSDDQIRFGSNDPTECPDGSKIGTVQITSPLLDQDVTGDVYLLSPKSVDPQSGQMFRLAIVARNDRYGLLLKLPGSAVADPVTGRLTATFDNNPRLPFSDLKVSLKGGSKGILAMPQQCGTSTSTATLTPWSGGAPVTQSTTATVGENCSNGFAPGFAAGMSSQQAGGTGSFSLSFSRSDGEQYFKGLTATLPPGLLANVGSVPLCSSEQAAADACPADSRIGSADASAGSGDPFVLEKKGDVYLTEGYKGGAFGLLVHVPVEAGPFTGAFALPTVTVRQALFVDRHDAHVTVVSDDFPTIDAGIPLRIRSVTVSIDRPGFMLNPTSCAPKAVAANLTSTQGASAAVDAPFGVTGCDDLPFRPAFTAATKGTLAFKQGAALKVHVGMPAGDANIESVETVLPKSFPSRLIPTINNACVYDVFQQDYSQCPADSFVGTVTASSPILDQPLTGPVYIVAPPNDVPRLEIVLLGQGKAKDVRVDLEGDVIVDIGDGRSKVTFNTVPDVPVTSFDLDLPTGPHSILDAPSNDLCKGPIKMFVRIGAQNGKVDEGYKPIAVSDCPKIAKVKVVSAKATSTGLKLRVLAPAEGRLVVSGASLKDVARTVNRKLTYSVTVPLTAKAKKALAKKGKLRTRPSVWFKPVNAKKASTVRTKTLTVKKHAAKKKAKKHPVKKKTRR